MSIVATSKTTRTQGPAVQVNCPKCGPNSKAESYEQHEKMGLYFIPMLTQRETCVRCLSCGAIQLSRLPLADLGKMSANELQPWLYERVSIVAKFIALASIILFCMPFVGLVLGIISLIMNFKSGGWPRTVSIVSIVLNTPITLLALAAAAFGPQ